MAGNFNDTFGGRINSTANRYPELNKRYEYIKDISQNVSHIVLLYHKKEKKKVIAKITEIRRVSSVTEINELVESDWGILKDLNHSNLVKYFELFSDLSRIYQLREYCESESLREIFDRRLATKTFFNFYAVFSIFLQVLEALAYLNSRELILEFLNTDDIYFTNGKLKITNFGNEKRKFNISSITSTPANRRQVERRFYNAPEKLRGQPLTIKIDTWCLGCLLYEICTFEIINDGFKLQDKIKLPHLYRRHPFIEDSIDDIMNKDPLQRISTVDLLERLVSYDTFIYPNIDILNEEEKVIGYEEIYDHIEMKKLSDEIEIKNDVYISYCYEDEPYIKDFLDNLVAYFKDELKYKVVLNDNKGKKNKKSPIDIAEAIMSSAAFIPLITTAYSQSTSCKHELTIAKIAVEKFIVLQIESDHDHLECAMNCLIASQKIYRATAYDSEQDFRKQWFWFDGFLNSIEELRSEKNNNQNPAPAPIPAPRKPTNNSFKYDGFVSHKWVGGTPAEFTKQIIDELKQKHKLNMWFDIKDIRIGENLITKMQDGILNSKVFLACISIDYDKSKNCRDELNYARSLRDKTIFVLKMDKELDLPKMEEGVGFTLANVPDKYKFDAYEWKNNKNLSKIDTFIRFLELLKAHIK